MPLWIIYHPPNTFTDFKVKQALANEITKFYDRTIPKFYVNVLFQPIEPSSYFIGGIPRPSPHSASNDPQPKADRPFIRITIQNIARTLPDAKIRDIFLGFIDAAIKPFIEDMGYDWEYSVEETRRDLWKINGMVPPMPHTKAEKEWHVKNWPVPFQPADGGLGEGWEQPWAGEAKL